MTTNITCDYNDREAERRLWNTIKLLVAVLVFSSVLAGAFVAVAFFNWVK